MVRYDEKGICLKCEKELKRTMVEYTDYHDGGSYDESYLRVDRNEAHEVSLGFYCNECYDLVGQEEVTQILEYSQAFLNTTLVKIEDEVNEFYKKKLNEIKNVRDYILKANEILKNKKTLDNMTNDELEFIINRNSIGIYNPIHTEIKEGFIWFPNMQDVDIILNKRKRERELAEIIRRNEG